jgi:hypothetical protein
MLGGKYSHSECDDEQWHVQLEYIGRSEFFYCEEILRKVMLTLAAGTKLWI